MKLSKEDVAKRKQGYLKGQKILQGRVGEHMFDNMLDFCDTIEAQQQEIERQNSVINKMDGCMVRCGRELISAEERRADMQQEIEQLQNDNINSEMNLSHMVDLYEQLQVQNAAMREASLKAIKILKDMVDVANVSGSAYLYRRDTGKVIEAIKALSEDTPDYHNPADVEALKVAREAICEGIKRICPTIHNLPHLGCCKLGLALETIDKQIGGGQDG